MTSKAEKERAKLIQDKCQEMLADLLRDDDNKYCVDCDAKGPRWASWNLGVFLCIRCAGIHRNLGVHISKVKSINLDSWTPEQVGSMQQMGNSKARAVFEANLPDGHRRPQTDSALEAFIRAKYEQRKYIAREWIAPNVTPAFDIEEEVKKDKEKRRHTNKPTSTGIRGPTTTPSIISDQSNSVPRPVSTHPASTTISADKVPKDLPSFSLSGSKSNNDLLGINFADSTLISVGNDQSLKCNTGSASDSDLFAAFDSKSKSTKDEEADFFNQKAPDMTKKLDTNSILKLYESNNTSNFFNPMPAMTQQNQSSNQQLLLGLQTNQIPAPVQQAQAFGNFSQMPLVPGIMPQHMSGGIVPASVPINNLPVTQAPPSFGTSVVTNPFLTSAAPAAAVPMPGPLTGFPPPVTQMSSQLASLQLDTKLINNWLGTSLSTTAPSFAPSTLTPASTELFPLNGSPNKVQPAMEHVAPVTSANPFLPSFTSGTNGSYSDSGFAASFPTDGSGIQSASTTSSHPLKNQSDFTNSNWANFNQAPAIPTGGASESTSSVVPPPIDLWQ